MAEEYSPKLAPVSVAQMTANREAGRLQWEKRLAWFAERGLKPRLLDMDDLAREAAGLPPDPPYERLDGLPPIVPPNERGAAEIVAEVMDAVPVGASVAGILKEAELEHAVRTEIPLQAAVTNAVLAATIEAPTPSAAPMSKGTAVTAGFTGEDCQNCGSFAMVRSGTCSTCRDCGATSGGCS